MKIGLVGYKGCGKSTLFEWLTRQPADPALAHQTQSTLVPIPEPRIAELCEIYKPKKTTFASIELLDTPGLSRTSEGNPARLAQLREADALVVVAAAFDGADPAKEIKAFQEDLILADLEIVTNRHEKVKEQDKRPVPKQQHEAYAFEMATLDIVQRALETDGAIPEGLLNDEQRKITSAFRLMNEKPRMLLVNTVDEETGHARFERLDDPEDKIPVMAVSGRLELDLMKMTPEERTAFLGEMGLAASDRDGVLRRIMDVSGQMLFLTAGEKEVRTWLIRKGGTALDAAGEIHTDMAKGFIRAEVMRCDDLVRLGSERAVKAENLVRREPKDYVIQEGDILLFHFS